MRTSLLAALLCIARIGTADAARPEPIGVDLRTAVETATVSDRFLSFAVDVDQLVGGTFWDPGGGPGEVRVSPYDFGRPALRALAGALAPAYLRLGGSASDVTWYDLGDAPGSAPAPYQEVLTRAQWDGAAAFARDLGLDLILTVNGGPGPRDAAGRWTADNARQLLEYIARRGDPVRVLEWGNEPNLFAVRAGISGYTAADYARDFAIFRTLAAATLPAARIAGPGNIYTRTLDDAIVGTVAFGPRLRELLPVIGPSVDIVAYHYYAAISTRCPTPPKVTPETALEPAYLDGIDEPSVAVAALRDQHAPGAPIWMTESGGQSCGGQSGLGDRFLNSFWYLNTLGRMARAGQEVFVRQTLSGSTYGLIDDATLAPTPDYWAALLWRRLMGQRVLRLDPPAGSADVRVFAHCSRSERPGAVTVLALNTRRDRPVRLRIRGASGKRPAKLHLVTAPDPAGREVLLNRKPLRVASGGGPPALKPRRLRGALTLPPLSYAFVEVSRASTTVCR